MKKESFAAYLKGGYWTQAIKNTALSDSSGTGVTLDAEFKSNLTGEFGFVYSNGRINFLFGLEVIRPAPIVSRKGTDVAGTELYDVSSEVSAYAPKLGIEISFYQGATSRACLGGAFGTATLTGRNSYVLTADGTAAFAGVVDFYEDLRSTAPLTEGSLGYEMLMADTTTFNLEAGYRSLSFTAITHNRDVTSFQGPIIKGDAATNMDGSKRTMNLSGPFIALSFRFWLH